MVKKQYLDPFIKTPVVAVNLEGEFVGRYESQYQCSLQLGIASGNIGKNLKCEVLRCGKYIIMYEETYNPEKPVTYKSLQFKRKAKKGLIKTSIKRNITIR